MYESSAKVTTLSAFPWCLCKFRATAHLVGKCLAPESKDPKLEWFELHRGQLGYGIGQAFDMRSLFIIEENSKRFPPYLLCITITHTTPNQGVVKMFCFSPADL